MISNDATLLIDAGNSNIKWAWGNPALKEITLSSSVATGDWSTLLQQWQHALSSSTFPQQIWLSSVIHAERAQNLDHCLRQALAGSPFPFQLHTAFPQAAQCGVINQYLPTQTLGADRWMMALAAQKLYPHQRLLIVSAGTATTIDALDEQGHFMGGVILPGMQVMRLSLTHYTARLPRLHEHHQAIGFATNTEDAIASGCLQAQLGAIERMYQQLAFTYTDSTLWVILTGGAAYLLAQHLDLPVKLHPNLVLTGLNRVAYSTD